MTKLACAAAAPQAISRLAYHNLSHHIRCAPHLSRISVIATLNALAAYVIINALNACGERSSVTPRKRAIGATGNNASC